MSAIRAEKEFDICWMMCSLSCLPHLVEPKLVPKDVRDREEGSDPCAIPWLCWHMSGLGLYPCLVCEIPLQFVHSSEDFLRIHGLFED